MGVSEPITWLVTQSKEQALRQRLGKQVSEKQKVKKISVLTLSWRRPISYRNQSIDWFLYDIGLRHERVNEVCKILEICGRILLRTNDYYLKVISYILLQSIKPVTIVELGQIYQTCFFGSILWNHQYFRSSYFRIQLIAWIAATLWQNSCKTQCPQKNICCGVHSCCNLNFKMQSTIMCTLP